MRKTLDASDFLAAPVGSQLVTDTFHYWYPRRGLTGFSLWGSPSRAEIEKLNRVMDVVLSPPDRHLSLVDMQLVGTVDPLAFRTMAEYVLRRWQGFNATIIRQALLRPAGYAGAVVAGFFQVVEPFCPLRVFDALVPALEWLGIEPHDEFSTAVLETRASVHQTDPLIAQLRAALVGQPGLTSLNDVARRLGVSQRTLQRRLKLSGTTFQSELCTARLGEAQHMMLTSGLSLTAIALELGFASLQHFSSRFRQQHGVPPSVWLRKRSRRQVLECEVLSGVNGLPPPNRRSVGGGLPSERDGSVP